jgi:predicted kinase
MATSGAKAAVFRVVLKTDMCLARLGVPVILESTADES